MDASKTVERRGLFRGGGLHEEVDDDEHATAYYGGEIYNGLYVVSPPAVSHDAGDNYGYLPSLSPPQSRYLYPETAGHLV